MVYGDKRWNKGYILDNGCDYGLANALRALDIEAT